MAISKGYRIAHKALPSKTIKIVQTRSTSSTVSVGKVKKGTSIAVSVYYSTGDSIVLGHNIGTRLSLGLPE